MFIQLSKIGNGNTEPLFVPVFVNPNTIECFYPFKETHGGSEIEVTKIQFNQGHLIVNELPSTIQSYIISALRG